MSDFCKAASPLNLLDPFKRVKYSLGQVLGVDELEQEQVYFLERGRLHNRSLHGYGTVCGLKVEKDGTKISVAPGLAVNPAGKEIRVTAAQCADLNQWLSNEANRALLDEIDGSAKHLYVVLCYQECDTDPTPVPGAPCRSQEENMAPSRITETFSLKFAVAPPLDPEQMQAEEEAVRRFGDLLAAIEVTAGEPDTTPASFANAVRNLPEVTEVTTFRVAEDDLQDVLDRAFRVWVTEVRPGILGAQADSCTAAPAEECVLLARVNFTLTGAGQAEEIQVREEGRPYLLHTRLLQEYMLRRREGITDHNLLAGLENDDHLQYLLVNPEGRSLIADLDADGHKVTGLAAATANGDAVRFEQAIKVSDAAGGDLANTYPNPTVAKLRGRTVANIAPANGQVLTWTGAQWEPRPAAGGGISLQAVAAELPTLPFVTITRELNPDMPNRAFRLWFHMNHGGELSIEGNHEVQPEFEVIVQAELNDGPPYEQQLPVAGLHHVERNVFIVELEQEEEPDAFRKLRFLFNLEQMKLVDPEMSLLEWVQERPLKWLGHDGGNTVTAFFLDQPPQQASAPVLGYQTVAAGMISMFSSPPQTPLVYGFGFESVVDMGSGRFALKPVRFALGKRYIVKGTPVGPMGNQHSTPVVVQTIKDAIYIQVGRSPEEWPPDGFMVEVSEITG